MNRTLIDDVANYNRKSDIPAFNPDLDEELKEGLSELICIGEDLMDIHNEDENDD